MGDGFMMTFPSVAKALRFTITVQEQVMDDDGPDVRVRMGLHTGEAISDITGDLFGRHVNMAARVANLAEGGQIMASLVVHEIAAGQDDIRFGEPSLAELKGFPEPQTVYEELWG
ncbi:MAG: adenylate/guanylate cyclase domain-containing protein [Actinomycetia bacterium]|nr:adenylate/guanylate cyclase domain-containing protein [Actinomycetes bacterium]